MHYVMYKITPITSYNCSKKKKPVKRILNWLDSRVSSTLISKVLSFFQSNSLISQISTAVTLGIIIGVPSSVMVSFTPIDSKITIVTCIIGILVGAAVQGAGGATLAFFWGWLIGSTSEAIASVVANELFQKIGCCIIAWIITAMIAWGFGIFIQKLFERYTYKRKKVRKIIVCFLIIFVLFSFSFFSYSIIVGIIGFAERISPLLAWVWPWVLSLILKPIWTILWSYLKPVFIVFCWFISIATIYVRITCQYRFCQDPYYYPDFVLQKVKNYELFTPLFIFLWIIWIGLTIFFTIICYTDILLFRAVIMSLSYMIVSSIIAVVLFSQPLFCKYLMEKFKIARFWLYNLLSSINKSLPH